MCNVEDKDRAPVAFNKSLKLKGNKCVKCDQQGVVVTRIHDSFCKDCFRVYIVHKFRSAIGKSKLIRDGEKVLVAFSGGANSAALLHLISDGLSLRAHKKLRFIPTLLHVDEYTVLENCTYGRLELQQKISELMIQTGFEAFITSMEQGLCISQGQPEDILNTNLAYWEATEDVSKLQQPSAKHTTRLKEVLSNLSSMTCKQDFVRNFKSQLIVAIARQLGFDKVLTAECSSRLSVRILADIAQGRGSQVSFDTGFSDSRNDDVMFIRPIRDLTSKEVVMYNNIFGVSSVFLPTLTTKSVAGASIERLTESFVAGLQADFPSTTSNIVRTSEKLSQSIEDDCMKCSFCKSALDTNIAAASALNAILFSKKLSSCGRNYDQSDSCLLTQGVDVEKHDTNLYSASSAIVDSTASKIDDVSSQLCFGCRLMIQDFGGDSKLLPIIFKQAEMEEHQSEGQIDLLKDQIADCLLDDS